jgi:hypothetical protein
MSCGRLEAAERENAIILDLHSTARSRESYESEDES